MLKLKSAWNSTELCDLLQIAQPVVDIILHCATQFILLLYDAHV